jgi:hypothetical protein
VSAAASRPNGCTQPAAAPPENASAAAHRRKRPGEAVTRGRRNAPTPAWRGRSRRPRAAARPT